ncbi:MAG: hypothetical protein ISR81_02135 [Nitrosopumilus sp.]|nr:hypothetical protein [Nitrosopumilus sp.]MBL7015573.1 hypothetical protein [Nitrosopumilus sp.]MBL7017695.1 hypothetical protein [Nitrosopumilus sp.]
MVILSVKDIEKLDAACTGLSEEEQIRHVGVINVLGHLVAGGFKKGITPLLAENKIAMTYMQLMLDFKMRQELDDILGPIDYIASRRTNHLIITIPIGENIVLVTAEPNADDKRIIKRAEELFDDITISTI